MAAYWARIGCKVPINRTARDASGPLARCAGYGWYAGWEPYLTVLRLGVRLLRQALDFQHQVLQLLRDTWITQAEIEML